MPRGTVGGTFNCLCSHKHPQIVCDAETRDIASGSRSGEAAHRIVCLLETLRGAARGASGAALRPVYAAVQAVQVQDSAKYTVTAPAFGYAPRSVTGTRCGAVHCGDQLSNDQSLRYPLRLLSTRVIAALLTGALSSVFCGLRGL